MSTSTYLNLITLHLQKKPPNINKRRQELDHFLLPLSLSSLTSQNLYVKVIPAVWGWIKFASLMLPIHGHMYTSVYERRERSHVVCDIVYLNLVISRGGAFGDWFTSIESWLYMCVVIPISSAILVSHHTYHKMMHPTTICTAVYNFNCLFDSVRAC